MKIKYLTYAQACAICAEHKHLAGQALDGDDPAHVISGITVAPYSRILQWAFIRNVLIGMPVADALAQAPGDRYDVILFSQAGTSRSNFQIKTLRAFLEKQGQHLNAAQYRRTPQAVSRA